MGNEISTIGGGAATVGAAVLAGVTFGQVEDFNNAVVDSAKYTARHAEKTVVRHVGETVAMAVATAGVSVASGVTFGQIKELNDAVVHCAKHTAEASERAGAELLVVADGLTDSIPVVGHVKGGICYAVGNHERGGRAMKSSSRTVGVIGGGVGGFFVGGPIGAVAGGVAGGAAMDGVITGAESAIHREFRPHGQIASWDQVAKAKNNDERIGGIVGGVMTPIVDALTGYGAGKTFDVIRQRINAANNPPTLLQKIEAKLNMDSTATNNAAIHPGSSSSKLKGGGHHSGAAAGGGGDVVKPVAGGVGVATFANNIETMFQKFKNGDVRQAVDDALDHVVSLAQGPTPEQQVAINGLGETADAVGSGTNGQTKQKAKRALQYMWNQVVQQFKEGLAEKSNSGEPAIAELNPGTATEQFRSSLNQSATPSGQGANECDRLVMQAMGALGGIVGGKAAEVLHDVAKSDKTKEVLQRMWDQVSKRLTDKITQTISGEATAVDTATSESENENTQSLVVRPASDDNRAPNSSNKELFFVFIVIYAALSALMMTASQK